MTDLINVSMYATKTLDKRTEELVAIKNELEEWLKNAKEGAIHVVINKKHIFYSLRTKGANGYKSEMIDSSSLIVHYLQKRYYLRIYNYLKRKLKYTITPIVYYNLRLELQNIYYENFEEIRKLIDPIDISDEECAQRWYNIPFNSPDEFTCNDHRILSECFTAKGIMFKYKIPFILRDGTVVTPDFLVWDKMNRIEMIWEHVPYPTDNFELTIEKFERHYIYQKNLIMLGHHYQMSFSEKNGGINKKAVSRTLDHFLFENPIL